MAEPAAGQHTLDPKASIGDAVAMTTSKITRPRPRAIPVADLVQAAEEAARDGRYHVARGLAEDAMAKSPRDPSVRKLGCLVAMAAGDITTAISDATRWVALAPADADATQALTRFADTYEIEDVSALEVRGLQVALAASGVSKAGVARLALRRASEECRETTAMLAERPADIEGLGRGMATARRLPRGLTADVFRAGIAADVVSDHRLERLLTGFRAGLLLDAGPDVLADPDRFDLALALLQQLWLNDHAWAVSPAELAAISVIPVDPAAALRGDVAAARAILLHLLYTPLAPEQLTLTSVTARTIRPKAFAKILATRLAADEAEAVFATSIAGGRPLTDAISAAVRAQYEAAPYPRWSSMAVPASGSLVRFLKGLPGVGDCAALDKPFRVLIAGGGTGQQAIRSALGYGPAATVTVIDLSRRSLGYAARMARDMGVSTIGWRQGDLLDLEASDAHYDVIECVGVLHHMADPLRGWRRLVAALALGGLMYIGLYSRTARGVIVDAQKNPTAPAPGCDDAAARTWRRHLMDLPADAPTSSLPKSRNFNALSEFRDLMLHACERHFDLAEIEVFLSANGLRFLGLTVQPSVQEAFLARFPAAVLPGRLADWATFEAENPTTFEGMYCFWVARL